MTKELRKVRVTWNTKLSNENIEKLIDGLDSIHSYIYGPQDNCVSKALINNEEYIGSINKIKIEIDK